MEIFLSLREALDYSSFFFRRVQSTQFCNSVVAVVNAADDAKLNRVIAQTYIHNLYLLSILCSGMHRANTERTCPTNKT